jgi:hypothetical protein
MPRSTVKPDVRAAAIADLQAGEQPAIVAERYNLNRDTVKQWKQRYVTEPVTVSPPVVRPTLERQQSEIGTLIIELLTAKLTASKAIATAASDPTWLRSQSAEQLAILGEWLDTTAFAIGDRLANTASEQADLIR